LKTAGRPKVWKKAGKRVKGPGSSHEPGPMTLHVAAQQRSPPRPLVPVHPTNWDQRLNGPGWWDEPGPKVRTIHALRFFLPTSPKSQRKITRACARARKGKFEPPSPFPPSPGPLRLVVRARARSASATPARLRPCPRRRRTPAPTPSSPSHAAREEPAPLSPRTPRPRRRLLQVCPPPPPFSPILSNAKLELWCSEKCDSFFVGCQMQN
jgi:hypothetical protein